MRNDVVLPAPLGPKQADDLAPLDIEVDVVDGPLAGVILYQAEAFQERHASPP